MSELSDLLVKRSSIKGRITKFKNYLSSLSSKESLNKAELLELSLKLSKFETLSHTFDDLQGQIEVLNSIDLDDEINERDDIEQLFISNIVTAQNILQKYDSKLSNVECIKEPKYGDIASTSVSESNNREISFKLPQIHIAKFDGAYFRWLEFRDTFTSLIHNNERITPIHKFHYLNSYLIGEASRIITNLEISSANYNCAWELLCERYNNKRQLINHHLNSLLHLQQLSRESDKSLRFMVDHVTKNLRALSSLGQPTDKWDVIIVHIMSSKLDSRTHTKWEEWRGTLSDVPDLQQFHKFLIERADVLESLQGSSNINHTKNIKPTVVNNKFDRVQIKSFPCHDGTIDNKYTCSVCRGGHRIYDCPTFKAMSVQNRIAEANKLKLCTNCLRLGHTLRDCRLGPCRECNKRHNTLLHIPLSSGNHRDNDAATSFIAEAQETVVNFSNQNSIHVLLSTALVEVTNPLTKQSLRVRALLDCGSQSSFITQSLRDKLCLKSNSNNVVNIIGIGNSHTKTSIDTCVAQLNSLTEQFKITQPFLVLPELTGDIPKFTINTNQLNLPPNIQLADPSFNQAAPIDVLIGAEIFWDVLGCKQLSLGPNIPKLRSSKFGWLISGPIYANQGLIHKPKNIQCHHSVTSFDLHSEYNLLNQQMTKFWELEEIPLRPHLSPNELSCEKHYQTNTFRLESGRFLVKLPLKDTPDCLGDSYNLAKKRLLHLEKRFRKNPDIKIQYINFMRDYAQLGHLSDSAVSKPDSSYFLCHHAVFKDTSESTKVRVVFDGSAATSSGYSINDLLMIGPNVQDSLFSILIRARQHKYLLTGDVEKMYRQILIHDEDRNLQLILWREDESLPIKTLRLNTVTYGMASSSYLSTRCLWQLGEECPDENIKTIIQRDFLVDDLITGCDDKQTLIYIKQSVTVALNEGCLNLRKFKTNLPSILSSTSNDNDNLTISESTSTLGIGWEPTTDDLFFPIQNSLPFQNNKLTKRTILSSLFKIFDPLGLLSPCIIQSKILLQQLWREKLGWDDLVPNNIQDAWDSFTRSLPTLLKIKIPRRAICDDPVSIELHSFSDASQDAYGACIYLRSINSKNEVTVKLLCSKSKVAPIKPVTIPRLELCASLLAANLCKAVRKSLRCEITREFHWCDSTVVLSWLHISYQNLKTFVANRVAEINELTDPYSWRYVPTNLNPADLISRGISPDHIEGKIIWWLGPEYLLHPEDTWPVLDKHNFNHNDLPELKQVTVTAHITTVDNSIISFERYSKYLKLKHSMAYVLRFIYNIKNPKGKIITKSFSTEELNNSFFQLCVFSQQQSFQAEYKLLSKGKPLNTKSNILALSPFFDNQTKLIRVGGRIDASNFTYDKKHPVLLHASHHFTKLIFDYEHKHNLHAGPQLLLSIIREFIWPINGRQLARRTVRNCFTCRRLQGKTLKPIMGNLPSQRVTANFPFMIVGIDFAGPFFILNRKGRGSKIIKCYLCLFICLTFKCLHLEAVSDMTKDAFLLTFRRFVSRRGRPAQVFCDNGRNFVAGAKEINNFFKSNEPYLSNFASDEGIKFIFSPSYAPHFGGIWEAGVKSAKFHVKRVMGNTHLTFEELSTPFAQVESILNSRPLCPMSSSPNDFQVLTPGHFLIGRALTALPSPALEDYKATNLQRYERLQQINQHFWARWQREYIAELQQRCKWRTNCTSLNVGDLVLLQEDNIPPLCWRLGRIQRLFPGSDGVSRVADVNTTRGCFRRPLVRLCPLPTAEELDWQ